MISLTFKRATCKELVSAKEYWQDIDSIHYTYYVRLFLDIYNSNNGAMAHHYHNAHQNHNIPTKESGFPEHLGKEVQYIEI